ncbi:MAG: tetratricopeptide repeat protein [Anaerolineae bacterium]
MPSESNACYAVQVDAERPLLSRLRPEAVPIGLDHQARFCLSVEYPFCPRYLAYRRTLVSPDRRPRARAKPEGPTAPEPEAVAPPPPRREGPDPEQLYQEGMAHYMARRWAEAQETFLRLKEVDPGRPGIDALLEEIRLFMRLQTVESGAGAAGPRPEPGVPEGAPFPTPPAPARGRARRFLSPPYLAAAVVVLALLALLGLRLAGLDISLASRDERTELLNRGRALMVVGDYDGAVQVFEQLLALAPGDPEAQAELERAQRFKTLSDLYAEAKAHIGKGEWDAAAERLNRLLALDPNYRDAASLAAEVERQRRLAALYAEAKALYDQGNWMDAAAKFDELRALDATYRSDVVEEYLFVCHLNQGLALIVTSGDSVERIKEAIRQFGAALSIHPRNKQAAEEQRLANLYLAGYLSYQNQEWGQAILKVQQVVEDRPDYAGGRAAQILCASYVALGDQARERNDLLGALEQYRKALAREDLQCPPAQEREQEVLLILYPPTPTPTLTPTPTHTPTVTPTPRYVPPTPTYTPSPTETPPPLPTDTPVPPRPTPRPPTDTPAPPTPTPKPPTPTPKPPTPTPPR